MVKDAGELEPHEERTYVHELIHGIQQQHFDIEAMRDGLEGNSDAKLALRALIEGDATLGTARYAVEYMSPAERVAEPPASPALIRVFRAAPRVIQAQYVFPYRDGGVFVDGLYQEGGWQAVDEAFARPPRSTEQVLHPDKYESAEPPAGGYPARSASGAGRGVEAAVRGHPGRDDTARVPGEPVPHSRSGRRRGRLGRRSRRRLRRPGGRDGRVAVRAVGHGAGRPGVLRRVRPVHRRSHRRRVGVAGRRDRPDDAPGTGDRRLHPGRRNCDHCRARPAHFGEGQVGAALALRGDRLFADRTDSFGHSPGPASGTAGAVRTPAMGPGLEDML